MTCNKSLFSFLNIFRDDLYFDVLLTRVLLDLLNNESDSWRKYTLKCWYAEGKVGS